MHRFSKFLTLFLIFCFSVSCKDDGAVLAVVKTRLPSYSNVNVSTVFTSRDGQLPGEDSVKAVLDEYYKKIWQGENLSGGLLVAKGDNIIFEKYRGYAREGSQHPISDTTPMHVASVSKTLTAMAVMKLAEAGKLKLTDRVTTFFHNFPYPDITVMSLLTQRSGLPKYEYFVDKLPANAPELSKTFLTNRDILDMLIKYKPAAARGANTGFMYCNTNFALLALIIEKVTATPFPQAMQEIVFQPLSMKHTKVFQAGDIPTAAQSFYYQGSRLYPLDRLDLIYGDKNVYTTPRDLLNFSKALYAKDFLKPEFNEMIFKPYSLEKPGINNYGIGFRMKIFDNGEKLTYHNGWWHGTNAVFAHLLKSNVTIVAIGNKFSRHVYSALTLSGLFEDFPQEKERFLKAMEKGAPQQDSLQKTTPENFGE